VSPEFWRGKRVFITGHTGFKGSWMSLWLQSLGADLTGYALRPPTNPSLFDIARVGSGMRSIEGDIRDLDHIRFAIKAAQPEIIFHMAAQSLVHAGYQNPVETYATNLMGLVHLLEVVRENKSVRAVVNVTSDKCYENKEWVWGYRETEAMGGYDPYSSSKGCAELITSAYRNSFFNPSQYKDHGVAIATARSGNVIGGGDWAQNRLVPDILRAYERGVPASIRHPTSIRPWQHVLEPLSGYMQLMEKLYFEGDRYSEGWNFGPSENDAKTVEWIVNQIAAFWGLEKAWEIEKKEKLHEAHVLRLDCSKSRHSLNWNPRWDLFKTLETIVAWHKAYLNRSDMRNVCIDQIKEYVNWRAIT
jgi:CDP-glucose 4,6-dehydratase